MQVFLLGIAGAMISGYVFANAIEFDVAVISIILAIGSMLLAIAGLIFAFVNDEDHDDKDPSKYGPQVRCQEQPNDNENYFAHRNPSRFM